MTEEPFEDFEIQREVGEDSGEPVLETSSWTGEPLDGAAFDGDRAGSSLWAWLLAIAVVALLAGGGWWWLNRGENPAPLNAGRGLPSGAAAAVPEAEAPEVTPEIPQETPPLPALKQSDPFVRTVVKTASAHPQLIEWMANDDLVRRFTLVICNFAYDEAPALHVPFLRPRASFSVIANGDLARIDPASYRRYDTLATVVASLDAQGSVEAYRRMLPLVEEVYKDLGYPGSFDQTLKRALSKVREVPRIPAEVDVRAKVLSYEFVDPQIEALTEPQKQLLRMGPRNLERIQAKASEIGRLLES